MSEYEIKKGDTIAVWFSSGAASAVAAKKTIEKYGDIANIRILNNPVIEEDEDNVRFLRDVEKWIGKDVEFVINPEYGSCSAVEVWQKKRFMSSPYGAPCTLELKKRARQEWEKHNSIRFHVLGFTADERHRHERFILSEPLRVIPVLIDEFISKQDCYTIIENAGIELPRVYRMGYPNANCIGCVKSSSATYWNLVRKMHPEVFKHRAKQSRQIGARLVKVKGERIFLDELDPKEYGKALKGMDFECGLFCGSK